MILVPPVSPRAAITILLVLVFLAATGVAGTWLYRTGYAAATAEAQRTRMALETTLRAIEDQRLAAQTERDRLARELEDAANADPILVPECLGPDRLRRLNQIGAD